MSFFKSILFRRKHKEEELLQLTELNASKEESYWQIVKNQYAKK